MGAWNTFSFGNDTTYDAIASSTNGKCLKGFTGTFDFHGGKGLNLQQMLKDDFSPSITKRQYENILKYCANPDKDVRELERTGVIIVAIYSTIENYRSMKCVVSKEDAERAIKYLKTEKMKIEDLLKNDTNQNQKQKNTKIEVVNVNTFDAIGWKDLDSRLKRINEEVLYIESYISRKGEAS